MNEHFLLFQNLLTVFLFFNLHIFRFVVHINTYF